MKKRRSSNQEGGSTFRGILINNRMAVAKALGCAVFLYSLPSWGGEAISIHTPSGDPPRSFCDAYRNMGKLYANPNHPSIQSFSIFGRMHWQYGHLEGRDTFGRDFTYDTAEFRRFRLGAKAKAFNYFELKAQAELSSDDIPAGGTSREVHFQQMWDMYVTIDIQKAFHVQSLDTLTFGYGARETHSSYEWHTSSNKIKTVERSAFPTISGPSTGNLPTPPAPG